MQFKDAAYEILKTAGEPLHYSEITDRALKAGILTTSGQTPHATMGAQLYTDTLKPNSRFRRGDKKGTFALRVFPAGGIQQQTEAINRRVRQALRRRLQQMHPRKFENLITLLLGEMGLDDTAITTYGGDGGIDVRGVLNAENLSRINVAVQAKRWKGKVGPKVVRELRGSLKVHEHGIVITPSDFTAKAKAEAEEPGKTQINLINGDRLVDLLIEHQVGVVKEEYVVPVLDEEFWSEILGTDLLETEDQSPEKLSKRIACQQVDFPLPIQAQYKGKIFEAELLDLDGRVRYASQVYSTPSGAAKAVAVGWKAVNGWEFWKYQNPVTKKWEKIGELKAK